MQRLKIANAQHHANSRLAALTLAVHPTFAIQPHSLPMKRGCVVKRNKGGGQRPEGHSRSYAAVLHRLAKTFKGGQRAFSSRRCSARHPGLAP